MCVELKSLGLFLYIYLIVSCACVCFYSAMYALDSFLKLRSLSFAMVPERLALLGLLFSVRITTMIVCFNSKKRSNNDIKRVKKESEYR